MSVTPFHYQRFPSNILQWRLLLSGLYPVEFRDFFMGDMYCSQAYAMGVSYRVFDAEHG